MWLCLGQYGRKQSEQGTEKEQGQYAAEARVHSAVCEVFYIRPQARRARAESRSIRAWELDLRWVWEGRGLRKLGLHRVT